MRLLWILIAIIVAGLIVLKGPAMDRYWQVESETEINQAALEDDTKENELASAEKAKFVEKLVAQIENRKPLAPLLQSDIVFIFHSDNRCDGNTDGQISKLSATQIDSPFKIQVVNDGDAWECKKKPPSSFEIEFDLQERLSSWDRLEAVYESETSNSFFVEGRGQSDYIAVYIEMVAEEISVFKLEYRSEDPG